MSQLTVLRLPNEEQVAEIGRSSDGLPLTASVAPNLHLGDRVVLRLKTTNILDHPYPDAFDEQSHVPGRFLLWLLCDGKKVPLTKLGEEAEPRTTCSLYAVISAIPQREIEPDGVRFKEIDLSEIFQITRPGKYLVIAEHRPVWSNDDPTREINAVKTSFLLLPK